MSDARETAAWVHDEDVAESLHLWVVMNRAMRAIAAFDERDLERNHGLHVTEFSVLELLYFKGALSLKEVGAKVLLTSGSTTHVVDKLEKRGLVARRWCDRDRRVCYAELTGEGRATVERVFPAHARALAQVMAGLTAEEKRIAAALLKRLGRSAAQQTAPRDATASM